MYIYIYREKEKSIPVRTSWSTFWSFQDMSTYEGCADILFGASDLLPYDSDSYVRRNPLIYPLCRSWFTSLSFEVYLMNNIWVFSFKGLSKASIWVRTVLICGHGAFMFCLSKCSKTKPKRNVLVLKGSPKSILGSPDCSYVDLEFPDSIWANVIRENIYKLTRTILHQYRLIYTEIGYYWLIQNIIN